MRNEMTWGEPTNDGVLPLLACWGTDTDDDDDDDLDGWGDDDDDDDLEDDE